MIRSTGVRPWDHGAMERHGAGRAEGAERAERAERAGMHWGPLKSADRVQRGMGPMKPWSAMGREGRRGREPYGAPWSGKGEGGGAGRAEGAEWAKGGKGGGGRAERAGMHWDPLKSADRVGAMGRDGTMEPCGHEALRVRGMGP